MEKRKYEKMRREMNQEEKYYRDTKGNKRKRMRRGREEEGTR